MTVRWPADRWEWAPIGVLLLGLAGAGIGLLILNVDRPFPDDAKAFTSGGAADLWMFLMVAQTALYAVAVLPIADSLRAVWRFRPERWGSIVFSMIALAIVIVLFVGSTGHFKPYYTFPHHEIKVVAITLFGSGVAFTSVFGMLLVNAGFIRLARGAARGGEQEQAIADFALLREHLQRLLAIIGSVIGAGILASAALRNAIVSFADRVKMHPLQFSGVRLHAGFPPSFPPEEVLIYGAALSILLALLWAPIYARSISAGAALRDAAIGRRREGESLLDWHQRRTRYSELLGLEATAMASFRAGVAILTPLASALLGLLFNS